MAKKYEPKVLSPSPIDLQHCPAEMERDAELEPADVDMQACDDTEPEFSFSQLKLIIRMGIKGCADSHELPATYFEDVCASLCRAFDSHADEEAVQFSKADVKRILGLVATKCAQVALSHKQLM